VNALRSKEKSDFGSSVESHYVPHPYPDELFSSWVARAIERTAYPEQYFRNFGIHGLQRFAGHPVLLRFLNLSSINLPSIIQQHCIFPLLSPFLVPAVREKFFKWASTGICRTGAAGKKGRPPAPVFARLCPVCVSQDKEPYYRRSHQLAGLDVCLSHNCFLTETGFKYGKQFTTARRAVEESPLARPVPANLPDWIRLSLIESFDTLLHRDCTQASNLDWRGLYRAAFNLGYGRRRSHGSAKIRELSLRLDRISKETFHHRTWEPVSVQFLGAGSQYVSQAPIAHLVFFAHLGLSAKNALVMAEGSFWRCPNRCAPCFGSLSLTKPQIFHLHHELKCNQCGFEFLIARTTPVGVIPKISRILAPGVLLTKAVAKRHREGSSCNRKSHSVGPACR
jgi:hypothetical protein